MINHYAAIGLYSVLGCRRDTSIMAYVMDDYGNLVAISDEQFDQAIYFRTGNMY